MMVWALKGPSAADYSPEEYKEVTGFLTTSIKQGVSRFGWGYMDEADLQRLNDLSFAEMNDAERDCWGKANFLLDVAPGDWVVHINLPYWGACLAGQVVRSYAFEREGNDIDDFRHTIGIDPDSIVEFERNDDEVLPNISRRLKLQGSYWRIYNTDDFLQTLSNLLSDDFSKKTDESVGVFYLKKDLSPLLQDITGTIHKTHPGIKLEELLAGVFRMIPNVIDVNENGRHRGSASDNGADLIVTYKAGLAVSSLEKEEVLVVQVKSYTGQHWETDAVTQTETAIQEYQANAGLIITTATATPQLEQAVEELGKKLGKPVGLIAGEGVARFILKYGHSLIL